MPSWEKLFDRFRTVQSLRGDALLQEQEAQRARHEFEQWVFSIVPQILSDIEQQAIQRATEFQNHTGADVTVTGPDPSKPLNPQAPWLAYLTLSLGSTLLYIYATRGGSSRLYLHMMPDDTSWVQKNQRVVSHSGCFVVRQDEGYEFRYLRGDPDGGPRDVMPMGTLVYRAFELLVSAHMQRTP